MAFEEVQRWLDDPGWGFSDDEKADILAKFSTDARAKVLAGNQLRLSDYSRKMNEGQAKIDDAQAKVNEADQKLNRELSEWSKVQAAGPAAEAAWRTKVETLEREKLALSQQLTKMGADAGLDPVPYLQSVTVPAVPDPQPTPTNTPAADLSGLAKTADIATMNKYMFEVNMALPMLRDEHQALTGKPLDTVALGAEIQRRATAGESMNPREVWEGMHDIPAKRATAAEVAAKERDDQNFQRGREAALSEQTLPVGAPAGKHAVIFQPDGEGKPHESALERPQPSTRTQSAIQALTAHTYRTEGAGAPGAAGASGR